MTIGSERLSETQLRLLDQAKRGLPVRALADMLLQVVSDPHIKAGGETLHPDWLGIFQENRSVIEKAISSRRFQFIEGFFGALSPYDLRLQSLNPEEARLSFLLGAGASKPLPSGIPTVKELLPDLLTRARRLDREDVTKLAQFCEDSKIDNIEDLLTAAQLSEFCSRNPIVLRLVEFLLYRDESMYRDELIDEPLYRPRRRAFVDLSSVAFLQDTLQVLFGLLSNRMLPAEPNKAHQAIAHYARMHPNVPIITTNYDCCMDRALGGQGIVYSYLIEFANASIKPKADDATLLIKLHGRLNWFYYDTCQEVLLVDIERTVSDYLNNLTLYPVIGVCKDCGGQRRGLLVPPLAMKFDVAPPLNPLLDKAAEAFAGSDIIIVVGFSFAEADLYIS